MIEYQKSMANNVLPKTDRLYQRINDKERQEIEKEERLSYLKKFKPAYGIYADQMIA
jgi:hypothetical protein